MEQLSPGGTGGRGRDVSLGAGGGVSGHRWRSVPPSGLRADGGGLEWGRSQGPHPLH